MNHESAVSWIPKVCSRRERRIKRSIYSIESSGEVNKCQEGDFARVRSKQQLVDYVEESSFCTVVSTVGRLEKIDNFV